MTHKNPIMAGMILTLILAGARRTQAVLPKSRRQSAGAPSSNLPRADAWESPGQLRHSALGSTLGALRIDSQGIEFVPIKGASIHWSFTQIEALELQKHRVVIVGYDNRKWPLTGTRRVELKFKNEMTPAVAASLTAKIGRPVRDGIPEPGAPATSVIAVRGSNGLLRIRQEGIDYVTTKSGQSRSWRWLDIQTLSNPDPYHLILFGYRDIYAFDLKETLSRDVFNSLSDEIWTHNEGEMTDHPVTLPAGTPINSGRRGDE